MTLRLKECKQKSAEREQSTLLVVIQLCVSYLCVWYVLAEVHAVLLFDLLLLSEQRQQGRLVLALGVGGPWWSGPRLKVRQRFGVVVVQHGSRGLSPWRRRVAERWPWSWVTQHVGVSGGPRHVAACPCLGRAFVGLSGHQQLLLGVGVEVLWVQGGARGLVHTKRAP